MSFNVENGTKNGVKAAAAAVASSNGERRRVALITGITGQDGSYLVEFLISKGYQVHGLIRRSSSFNTGRIQHLYKDPRTHEEGCNFVSREKVC